MFVSKIQTNKAVPPYLTSEMLNGFLSLLITQPIPPQRKKQNQNHLLNSIKQVVNWLVVLEAIPRSYLCGRWWWSVSREWIHTRLFFSFFLLCGPRLSPSPLRYTYTVRLLDISETSFSSSWPSRSVKQRSNFLIVVIFMFTS